MPEGRWSAGLQTPAGALKSTEYGALFENSPSTATRARRFSWLLVIDAAVGDFDLVAAFSYLLMYLLIFILVIIIFFYCCLFYCYYLLL